MQGVLDEVLRTKASELRVRERNGQLVVRKTALPPGEADVLAQIRALGNLPAELTPHYPLLLDVGIAERPFWYEMPFYRYPSFRNLVFYSAVPHLELGMMFQRLLDFLFSTLYRWRVQPSTESYFEHTYVRRMRDRLRRAREADSLFEAAISAKEIEIEGRAVQQPEMLLACILERPPVRHALLPRSLCSIHGQLEFDHILMNLADAEGGSFVLLDTSGFEQLSDPAYDVGKILQSLRGKVDLLKEGDFELEYDVATGRLVVQKFQFANSRLGVSDSLCSLLARHLQGAEETRKDESLALRSDFAEAVHLCSAVPGYYEPSERGRKRALAFYILGAIAFDRFFSDRVAN